MKVDILNQSGASAGSIDLDDSIFGIEPNDHAIYLAVKHYMKNQRQGTNKSKERGEIKGSTRKIKKQKGTGTARAGSIKNPLFRGGGTIFGPKPRDYKSKLNKKVRTLARNSALTQKAKADGIKVLEDFHYDLPKTKTYAQMLKDLGVANGKTLLVTGDMNESVALSAQNLPKAHVVPLAAMNTYGIVAANTVMFTKSAIEALTKKA